MEGTVIETLLETGESLDTENIEEVTPEDMQTESVSSGDYVTMDDIYAMQEEFVSALSTEQEEVYALWNKPLSEYTVTEGLLLLIFVLLLWFAVKQFIGGIFK